MTAALVGSPATYFLALIVGVSAALPRLGQRAWGMGPMALTAIAMYVISTGIITSYHYVPEAEQVGWWTKSLFIVGMLYLLVLAAIASRTLVMAPLAAWTMFAFFGAMTVDSDIARKAFWFLQYAEIAASVFVCWLLLSRSDLIGQLMWGVLFIAEGIGAAQVFDCQFLHGMSQTIVDGSACEAVYGSPVAPYAPMVLPTLVVGWILFRWFRPRER